MAEIKVITIGRHYCAGGSTIGKLVAEKLGIPCYDREIIDMAAQKSGIAMRRDTKIRGSCSEHSQNTDKSVFKGERVSYNREDIRR